jgi:transcriptional regulator with PAS, ATPase and Fis domain
VSERQKDVPTAVVGDRSGVSRLVATWNGGTLSRDLPASGAITIGRGEDADVVIDDASVSRLHARLEIGPELVVEDLGSSNGTFVEGKKLAPRARAVLGPASLVELGSVLVVVKGPKAAPRPHGDANVVVRDPEMDKVYELVEMAARSKLSVVLLGETGVGKEVLASQLHADSPRSKGPFVKINCAAMVETLLEAELFGYEKGAFTGAQGSKAGLIESAHGGTFFLDEVGELPLTTQAKLLRVLESGQIMRLGGLKPRDIDVRFVSATNRDLGKQVKAGRFREDLFFRLDGLSIRIPPLRKRTSEIAPLAERFVEQACAESGRPRVSLGGAALDKLLHHRWPGNVRELKNVIARAVLFCKSSAIGPQEIRFESSGAEEKASAGAISVLGSAREDRGRTAEEIAESERDRIVAALAEAGGNQTRAAKLLGISRRTLVYRLDALGLPRPRKADDDD